MLTRNFERIVAPSTWPGWKMRKLLIYLNSTLARSGTASIGRMHLTLTITSRVTIIRLLRWLNVLPGIKNMSRLFYMTSDMMRSSVSDSLYSCLGGLPWISTISKVQCWSSRSYTDTLFLAKSYFPENLDPSIIKTIQSKGSGSQTGSSHASG